MNDVSKIRQLFEQNLAIFSALGDPIRQQLLLLMMENERKSVAQLAANTHLTRPTISHHLKVLKDAHIIIEQKAGRKTFYCPHMGEYFAPIQELVRLIAKVEKNKGGNQ